MYLPQFQMSFPALFLAQQDGEEVLFLGDDFMPWMVLAFGAALVVGNLLALVRPPKGDAASDAAVDPELPPARPPMARTVVMIAIGAVAAAWGLASLLG